MPTLVVANWGGLGLHLRGTIAGWGISSKDKWLKVQLALLITFSCRQTVAMQRQFFDRYLKGEDNGWETEPRVEVGSRGPDDKVKRKRHARIRPSRDPVAQDVPRRREEGPRTERRQ